MYTNYLLFCLGGWLLFACGESNQQTTTEQTDAVTTPPSVVESSSRLTKYSGRLQKIVKTDEGVLRGIKFGDSLEKVQTLEEAKPLESDSVGNLGYNLELGNYEDADIMYFVDKNNRVFGFTLDIYLNTKPAVDSLFGDFKNYFDERYGKSSFDKEKLVIWNLGDTAKITAKDVSIKQAPGMQIQIVRVKK